MLFRSLTGLQRYLGEARRDEFVDNLCRKLLAYALGRSLLLSDDATIEKMKAQLVESDYRFHSVMEVVVTSPQFLRKRGHNHGERSSVESSKERKRQ